MCAVSAIIHNVQDQFPPLDMWPKRELIDLKDIIDRLDKIDKKLGAKDCHEPTKDKFLRQLDARVKKLERRAKNRQPAKSAAAKARLRA